MKKEEINFIKDWFYSDLNIEIEVSKNKKQKGIIILESNVYYYNRKRYKGDKRRIMYDSDNDNDEIYDFLENNFRKYFYGEYSLEEIIDFLYALEENGLKLKVL